MTTLTETIANISADGYTRIVGNIVVTNEAKARQLHKDYLHWQGRVRHCGGENRSLIFCWRFYTQSYVSDSNKHTLTVENIIISRQNMIWRNLKNLSLLSSCDRMTGVFFYFICRWFQRCFIILQPGLDFTTIPCPWLHCHCTATIPSSTANHDYSLAFIWVVP